MAAKINATPLENVGPIKVEVEILDKVIPMPSSIEEVA